MSLGSIETVSFDLTVTDPRTGEICTGTLYRVDGIDRDLSISELVMAICLDKATTYESEVVDKMAQMANTTLLLEALTDIQTALVEQNKLPLNPSVTVTYPKADGTEVTKYVSSIADINALLSDAGVSDTVIPDNASVQDVISELSNVMDSKNSVNQADMIDLQSLTNKRDQAYDMITNILKSFYNVLAGSVNNL